MKHKDLKIALLSVAGFVVVLFSALQIVLNSKLVTDTVDKFAAENITGELRYARLHISLIKSFPRIRLSVDSLSLTYPHERFDEFYRRSSGIVLEGRGELADTLLRFDHFTVAVNPWQLLRGRARLSELKLGGLAAYAHQFNAEKANWDIFVPSDEPKDTTSKGMPKLPKISVGRISFEDNPHLVYVNHRDTLLATLDFERFSIMGPRVNTVGLDLVAAASVYMPAFGTLDVPVEMSGCVSYLQRGDAYGVETPGFDARIAYIPLHAEGKVMLETEGTDLSAKLEVTQCPVDTLLRNYADKIVSVAKDFTTDARLTVELEADGRLSDKSVPHFSACVQMPDMSLTYIPTGLDAFLNIDIDADVTPSKFVTADIHEFVARTDGLNIEFDGSARDLIGRDPLYKLAAAGQLDLDRLKKFIPDTLGIGDLSGQMNLDFSAKARQSELQTFKFKDAVIQGHLSGSRLSVSMPKDSLAAEVFIPDFRLVSNPEGLDVNVKFDSVYFNQGVKLIARVRDMNNRAGITKVNVDGVYVPRLEAATANSDIFVKAESYRFGLRDMDLSLAAQKRVNRIEDRRKRALDSLQAIYPDTPRNELALKLMEERRAQRRLPDYMQERDFAKSDIRIKADTSITNYIREWAPSGKLSVRQGFMASPMLPLRTRLTSMDVAFNDDDFRIDTLSVTCGSSDLGVKGTLSGLLNSLVRRSVINTRMAVYTNRLNLNEIVAAMDAGHPDVGEVAPEDEDDESFVTTRYENAEPEYPMTMIVVPGNVDADLDIFAKNIDFSHLKIDPFEACIKMKERTLQISDAKSFTSAGDVILNAYYSTISKKDISAGVDVKISDASAQNIIELLPAVDSLVPALKSFEGNFNVNLAATVQLDTNLNVILPSAEGMLRISGHDLMVRDAGDKLRKITRLLLFKDKNIGHIDDLNVNVVVHDNKVEVFPFELGVDRYKLALRGMQGFDKTMYYHASILRSPFLIRFGINIFGTLDNWRFSLGPVKYRNGQVPQYTQEFESAHVNMLQSIKNIFNRGVKNVRKFNANNLSDLNRSRLAREGNYSDRDSDSYLDIEAQNEATIQLELMSQDQALQDELDSVLEETAIDAASLMKDYEKDNYSDRDRKMVERLKAQSDRKAERKSAKKSK